MRLVLTLAAGQRGVVTSAQLAECGFSPDAIRRLVNREWLRPIRRGAFAVVGHSPSVWDDVVAVGLLGGPNTALSHFSAARIHDLPHLVKKPIVELSALRPRRLELSNVLVHRVRQLDRRDVVQAHGVPVTSPARTIVDLSSALQRPLLERVIDEGCFQGLWKPADIHASEQRAGSRRRPGSGLLRAVLEPRLGEHRVDTILELRVVRLLAPLRPFVTQYQVLLDGKVAVVDIAWPDWLAGVEIDGRWPRATSYGKFHSERAKGNLLLAHGWKIVHVTAAMDDGSILRDVMRILPEEIRRRAF